MTILRLPSTALQFAKTLKAKAFLCKSTGTYHHYSKYGFWRSIYSFLTFSQSMPSYLLAMYYGTYIMVSSLSKSIQYQVQVGLQVLIRRVMSEPDLLQTLLQIVAIETWFQYLHLKDLLCFEYCKNSSRAWIIRFHNKFYLIVLSKLLYSRFLAIPEQSCILDKFENVAKLLLLGADDRVQTFLQNLQLLPQLLAMLIYQRQEILAHHFVGNVRVVCARSSQMFLDEEEIYQFFGVESVRKMCIALKLQTTSYIFRFMNCHH